MRARLFGTAALFASLCLCQLALGQIPENKKLGQDDKFRQLQELLPTPNAYRTASGAPGHEYWQQRVDYTIEARLDDSDQTLTGSQLVTYSNNSPDTLRYLWMQLDRNHYRPDSRGSLSRDAWQFEDADSEWSKVTYGTVRNRLKHMQTDYGYRVDRVALADWTELPHRIVDTMMRIELNEPLAPGGTVEFEVDFGYKINDREVIFTRSNAEYFEDDGNWLYGMALWHPRMAVYSDYQGWHHKQFMGRGEFALEFGDFDVKLTVPDDHIVSATGVLQNPGDVLSGEQRDRLERARDSETPVFVVTPEEAEANESSASTAEVTWHWVAEDVRDFAWTSSRKFIWDAMGHTAEDGHFTLCQSLYPKEAEPLWSRYSTHAVAHTLDVYNKYSFTYPYPTAISVNGVVGGGMEYPMICFNGPRPEEDGTYSERTKYGLISVIIHEVGHFYFPMIVNTDERNWTWMDEGLNSFVQVLAEQEWEDDYPSRRGKPANIVPYMTSHNQRPIMTNSESLLQFGANAYAKPATALNILRESVMGRENFDFAFREFSQRWKFKRPEPADFFRTMEDASGVDLDWFWRGWFYTTDHVDIAVTNVARYNVDTRNPEIEKRIQREERETGPAGIMGMRNAEIPKRTDRFPELLDFYNDYDELDVTEKELEEFQDLIDGLDPEDSAQLSITENFYVVDLENVGGLVMPVIMELRFADGTSEEVRFPVESWVRDSDKISKMLVLEKELIGVTVDPRNEMADADMDNNHWPPRINESRFRLHERSKRFNAMKEAKEWEESKAEESGDPEADAPSGDRGQ